mmetsp:Transcript_1734/g.3376  ORF Transcript_1734/g.3376 Transcript_1734/m.3376 type:complete len:541 (+) Transcript_1734:163-1785(+)
MASGDGESEGQKAPRRGSKHGNKSLEEDDHDDKAPDGTRRRSSSKSRVKSSKDETASSHHKRSSSKSRTATKKGDDEMNQSGHGTRRRSSIKHRNKLPGEGRSRDMDGSGHGGGGRHSRSHSKTRQSAKSSSDKNGGDGMDDLEAELLVDMEKLQRQLEDEKEPTKDGENRKSRSMDSSGHGRRHSRSGSKTRRRGSNKKTANVDDDDVLVDMEELQRQLEEEAKNQVNKMLQEEKQAKSTGRKPLSRQGSDRFRQGAEERAAETFGRDVDGKQPSSKQSSRRSSRRNSLSTVEAAAAADAFMASNAVGTEFSEFAADFNDNPSTDGWGVEGDNDASEGFGADFANFEQMMDGQEQSSTIQPHKRRNARRRGSGRFRQGHSLSRHNSRRDMGDEPDADEPPEHDPQITDATSLMERARIMNSTEKTRRRGTSLSRQGSRRGFDRRRQHLMDNDIDNDDLDESNHSAPDFTLEDDDEEARALRDKRELRKALMRERAKLSRAKKEKEGEGQNGSTGEGIRRVSSTQKLQHSKIQMAPAMRK